MWNWLFNKNNVSKDIIHKSKVKPNSIYIYIYIYIYMYMLCKKGTYSSRWCASFILWIQKTTLFYSFCKKGLMDTVYISHGSPMMAIDESIPARQFLKSWQQTVLKERPKAILVISGHWDTKEPTVNVVNINDTIYDFYGFPKPMYQVLDSLSILFFFLLLIWVAEVLVWLVFECLWSDIR